jgi:tetrahydromethanopterin S-methyltransferase subunit F
MAEEGAKAAGPIRMVAIDNMVENIRYKAQILARTNKLDSGISESGIWGFAAGLATAIILIVIPVLLIR